MDPSPDDATNTFSFASLQAQSYSPSCVSYCATSTIAPLGATCSLGDRHPSYTLQQQQQMIPLGPRWGRVLNTTQDSLTCISTLNGHTTLAGGWVRYRRALHATPEAHVLSRTASKRT